MSTRLRAGAATDVGRVRQVNQDMPLVADTAQLWAVADGMGGHRGGEVAAAVAVETLERAFVDGADPTLEGLLAAAESANEAVLGAADADPELHGMGTTLVAIARTDAEELAYVNVGDSRIYLLRDGELSQLTDDHSLVEDMVREGSLTPEEARVHPRRNIVTRALGIPGVRVDAATIVPYTGDRFLLCSDGLFNEVDEDRITATLRRLADPREAADELVRLANHGGGRDNITVVVLDVVDDGGRAEAGSRLVRSSAADGDVAGFSTALDPDAAPQHTAGRTAGPTRAQRQAARRATRTARRAAKPRALTWRVAIFVLLFLAVLGGGAAAIAKYARDTFFVGLDTDGTVAVFRGKPGGVLWFDPTLEADSAFALTDLVPQAQDSVTAGIQFGTVEEAQAFIDRNTTTTSTSTTTTSTTATTTPTTPTTTPVTATPLPTPTTAGTPTG